MLWRFKEKAAAGFLKQFPEFSEITLQLLWERGLRSQTQIDEFFNPDYKQDLHDPFLMLGMEKAVKRIFQAINKKESIAIFGDYDADGVCGVVILETALRDLGAPEVAVYIPDRYREGYGLNKPALENLARQGVKLILTVDCGISDLEEVKLAKKLKMDVVITDHHHVPKKIPPALAAIDPHQPKDEYPFKDLSGAGVAFKLAGALFARSDKVRIKLPAGWEKNLLDLVALATVADCMPLLGENRTLVRYGLYVLAKTKRLGLQELMRVARLSPVFDKEEIKTNLDTYSLGFVLAPRLNAAARVDHANVAYRLLNTQSLTEAVDLAQELDGKNRERQKITEQMVKQIDEQIADKVKDDKYRILVEADKSWQVGIVGLAAGKICEKYHRPTIIFGQSGPYLRGSARSIHSFNIIEALTVCESLLHEFGGHPGAAGLALEEKNLAAFAAKMNDLARQLKTEDLTPMLEIDGELTTEDISWEFFDQLEKFAPFGEQNEQPVFCLRNLTARGVRSVGANGQHLKLELESEPAGKIFRAIGFGLAKNGGADLKEGDKVEAAFELIADQWNGTRNLQLKIIDLKKL